MRTLAHEEVRYSLPVARWVETADGSLVNLDQAEELSFEQMGDGDAFRIVARMSSREIVVLRTCSDQVEAEIEMHRLAQEVDARHQDT